MSLVRIAHLLMPGAKYSAIVRDSKSGKNVASCTHRHRDTSSALECADRMRRRHLKAKQEQS